MNFKDSTTFQSVNCGIGDDKSNEVLLSGKCVKKKKKLLAFFGPDPGFGENIA